MARLDPKAFALASGILWAACLFTMTVISYSTGYAADFLNVVASIYPGYKITPTGSIIGAIYGFVDAFIGMYVLIWLYTYLRKKF